MLNQAGRMVGGNQNLAIGGIGALAGVLMGSGRGLGGAIRGGIGGGAVTMLGLMAWQALKNNGHFQGQDAPPAYREPQTDAERAELEQALRARPEGNDQRGQGGRTYRRIRDEPHPRRHT